MAILSKSVGLLACLVILTSGTYSLAQVQMTKGGGDVWNY